MITGRVRLRRHVPRRRDDQAAGLDRAQVLLRAARPVLVGHFDRERRETWSPRSRERRAAPRRAGRPSGRTRASRRRPRPRRWRPARSRRAARRVGREAKRRPGVAELDVERRVISQKCPSPFRRTASPAFVRRPARASPAACVLRQLLEQVLLFLASASSGRRRARSRRGRRGRGPTTFGMPLPRSLNRAPGCVPAGTLTSSSPFIVGTRNSPPSASVGKVTGSSQ